MYILVTTSSKHGTTDGVADAITKRLEVAGLTVDHTASTDVTTVEPCDTVVVGFTVYILQWMPEAHDFMERFKDNLRDKPVWAFSVSMDGVPSHSQQDDNRVSPFLTHVSCRELRTFPGRYRPELLSLHECPVTRLAGVVEGDFRDWDAIDTWVDDIAAQLGAWER